MFQHGIFLFRLAGIPVHLDLSFLLVLPLWALYIGRNLPHYFALLGLPQDPRLLQGPYPFLLGLLAATGLFLSVLLHEVGHALAARRYGVATRRITLWLLGGVAQMERIPREPMKELVIALAGPLVSLLLFLLFRTLPWEAGALGFLGRYLALVNLGLALFNLLPALPLDGGRVYRALLALRKPYLQATRQAVALSQALAWALGLFGLLVLNPLLVLIAFFVYMASRADAEATLLAQALEGLKAKSVLDIGTGTGVFAEAFAALGLFVVGLDPRADRLEVARAKVKGARFVEGRAEALPFPDGSFDLAFFGLALHHLDPVPALREASRVARRVAVLEWPYREEEVGPPLGRRFSLEALEGLFREALGSPPRFLVAEGYVLALWDKG